jgi:transposase
MTIVANSYACVIGVDTHARTHTLAVIDPTGAVLDIAKFDTTTPALARAISWIAARTTDTHATLVVIEGIGSYGAKFARACTDAGYLVVEPLPTAPALRRTRGKSDPIDAELIARSVLPAATNRLRTPRDDQGERAAMRILITAREQLNTQRTATINALTALLRTTDLHVDARRPLSRTTIATIATWRTRPDTIAITTARTEARRLARTIRTADAELAANAQALTALVKSSPAAVLLNDTGIGAITAATIYIAWSHPGRLHSEAAFANLAGACPLPASSGNTTRHRVNRGGDRRLNHALHTIALTRMRVDPTTQAYVQRRLADNRTPREIRRCLKRYIARQLHRELTAATLDRT